MNDQVMAIGLKKSLVFGFIAGFFGTLVFHQLTLAALWGLGVAPFPPYPMASTHPFGVPAVFSLSFWGGIWGILFALIHGIFPRRGAYWAVAFLFGAILPSLVALLVVLPLKGRPMGGGWHPALLMTAFLINGAWGIGTGLILRAMSSWFSSPRDKKA
jgi:MFS family permease